MVLNELVRSFFGEEKPVTICLVPIDPFHECKEVFKVYWLQRREVCGCEKRVCHETVWEVISETRHGLGTPEVDIRKIGTFCARKSD